MLGRGIDTRKRFIHEVEVGVLDQGSREKDPLLLASRETTDLTVSEVGQPDAVQRLHRGVPMTPSHRPEPTDLAVKAHANDVERGDGKIPIDGLALRHVPDPTSNCGDLITEKSNGTTHSWHQIKARLDHGALSRTVRTDHGRQHPPRNIEVEIPEDRSSVVRDGHIVNRHGCLWIMLGADWRISMTMMDWHVSVLPFLPESPLDATL